MLDLIRLRLKHGRQAIPHVDTANPPKTFRGFPRLSPELCASGCSACETACPTGAIGREPMRLDLGACIFCNDCVRVCPTGAIEFTPRHHLAADTREKLVVFGGVSPAEYESTAIAARSEIRRLFGRSLRLRQVSAGGCNGCELELGAAGNVNFDVARFGVEFVASPRHADGIVLTGPVTRSMLSALMDAYQSIPEPSIVIAFGACAISGGVFAGSPEVDRSNIELPVDLYVPGCPPHPLVFIRALLDFLGRNRSGKHRGKATEGT